MSFPVSLMISVEGERWAYHKAGLKGCLGARGSGAQAKRWDFSGQAVRGAEFGSHVS